MSEADLVPMITAIAEETTIVKTSRKVHSRLTDRAARGAPGLSIDQYTALSTAVQTMMAQRESVFHQLVSLYNRWLAAGSPAGTQHSIDTLKMSLQWLGRSLYNHDTIINRIKRYLDKRNGMRMDYLKYYHLYLEVVAVSSDLVSGKETLRPRYIDLHVTATAALGPHYERDHEPVVFTYPTASTSGSDRRRAHLHEDSREGSSGSGRRGSRSWGARVYDFIDTRRL